MSKKVMLSIPDDIYNRLELASMESMRPIATEALYRVRLGLDSSLRDSGGGDVSSLAIESDIGDSSGAGPVTPTRGEAPVVGSAGAPKGLSDLPRSKFNDRSVEEFIAPKRVYAPIPKSEQFKSVKRRVKK